MVISYLLMLLCQTYSAFAGGSGGYTVLYNGNELVKKTVQTVEN